MNIGRYIKKIRKERGITQEKLAELIGVCDKTIRRIENEKYSKETESIRKVMDALGIRTSDFKTEDNFVLNNQLENDELNEIFKEIGYSNSKEVINQIEESIYEVKEFIKRKEYSKALEIYLGASKIFKTDKIFLNIASLYYIMDKYEEAINTANSILNSQLYGIEAMNIKGKSLSKLKRFDEAIDLFKTLVVLESNFSSYYNLGVTYYMSGNTYKAIEEYKNSLSINNEFASAHLNISICYFDTMQYDLSLYHINEALRLDSSMYEAYGRKGEYYRFFENYDEAIKYFELCLNINPENYQSLFGMAISLQMKEKEIESINYFKRFFKLYSNKIFTNGEETVIINIGYKKTNIFTFKKINNNIFEVFIKNKSMCINLDDDSSQIYIGGITISDDTGSILYPTIGKIYKDNEDYNKCINNIKQAVTLHQYFNNPIYVDFEKEIKVDITEKEKCVMIEINFGNSYKIVGLTNSKGKGFSTFIKLFDKYEQFRIQIVESDNIFIIDCVDNINIKKL